MSHSMGDNAEKLKVWQYTGMSDLGSQIPPDAAPEVLAISHVQFLDTDSEIPGFDGSLPTSGLGLGGQMMEFPVLDITHNSLNFYALLLWLRVDASCHTGDTRSFVIGPMLVMLVLLLEPFHTFDLQGLFINPLPT
ncbi:hypothetical protein DFH07DRAFT_778260 [Mycena maculata]|uniref:Uncharacterized protein n=1 Tax=Mycena maculata TaxID=230809 RepID=A0AAD7IE16_9AGAR|nr:hypothetical protein DFH07DRAFT_778260 [Mycena maculata]